LGSQRITVVDEYVKRIYLLEAATQCQFAANAIDALNNLLTKWEEARRNGDVDMKNTLHHEIFRTLHSLMTHASNISKLFWPAYPPHRKSETDADYQSRCSTIPKLVRAEELRNVLGLPGDQHVLKSRALRDHLEHFDERLDHWQATSIRRNYFHDSIGSREKLVGFDDEDFMRWFDPIKKLMLFRGESFDIQAIANGISDIFTKLENYRVKP
jgi:hypothetical protein